MQLLCTSMVRSRAEVSVDVRWRNCGRKMEIVVPGCAAWYSTMIVPRWRTYSLVPGSRLWTSPSVDAKYDTDTEVRFGLCGFTHLQSLLYSRTRGTVVLIPSWEQLGIGNFGGKLGASWGLGIGGARSLGIGWEPGSQKKMAWDPSPSHLYGKTGFQCCGVPTALRSRRKPRPETKDPTKKVPPSGQLELAGVEPVNFRA